MNFRQYYSIKINNIISSFISEKKGLIFVLLVDTKIIHTENIEKNITDRETFFKNGGSNIFSKDWFVNIFAKLSKDKEFDILSFAQYSYLVSYIDKSFFKERVIFINDNLRILFPISKIEYIENNENENIEERPNEMPIYQTEQHQINNQYFYSVNFAGEGHTIIDLFNEEKKIKRKNNIDHNFEVIDVSSDMYALDIYYNECIKENNFKKNAVIKLYSKQPISNSIQSLVNKLNFVTSKFGGELYELIEESVQDHFIPNINTINLLSKYWGSDADFRTINIYKNPDINNETVQISQGLVVEKIIKEYDNSKEGKNTRDLFLTAPTGSGKSLLFQLPAFYVADSGDVSIVVSPLIALMKDQVNEIRNERKFEKVAYLNSELSLIERDKILQKCKNSEIHILYMSPELLLSYDITHFVGSRKIGLLVIDEAHLITTWGRDFRVDYWFLGNHIRKMRKYHNISFPMVAVTATAIYGGSNDMVFDSITSLVMKDPYIYIGQVKRSDITFVINNYDSFQKNYEKNKLNQTVEFIKNITETNFKTLIYTPYTKHICEILTELRNSNLDIAVGYYGSLPADQKNFSFQQFKLGIKKIMVSTKAFGMGVNISDIEVVYHHAPSGLLPDYIQEIGRVARKECIKGFAVLNYSSQDQRFTKALHGMSALKHFQIKEVLKKIHKVYLKNNKSRNLLLSVDDFGYIFDNAIDLDQKVLTALMMIEKDYLIKHRFNVLIARPKKLFVKIYARIKDNDLRKYQSKFPNTIQIIKNQGNGNSIIEMNLDRLWYKYFNNKSFPLLKRDFYTEKLFHNYNINIIPQLKISFERLVPAKVLIQKITELFETIKSVFNHFDGAYFNEEDLIKEINSIIGNNDASEKIGKFLISSYSGRVIQPGVIEANTFLQKKKFDTSFKYRVFSNQYLASFSNLTSLLNRVFNNSNESLATCYVTNKEVNIINYVRLGYFLELSELGVFEIKGGENPMIFIRINDPFRIEKDSNSSNYENILLKKTLQRHTLSNQIFDHFFLRTFSNVERWDFIEDFFLGSSIDALLEKYKGGKANNLDLIKYLKEKKN